MLKTVLNTRKGLISSNILCSLTQLERWLVTNELTRLLTTFVVFVMFPVKELSRNLSLIVSTVLPSITFLNLQNSGFSAMTSVRAAVHCLVPWVCGARIIRDLITKALPLFPNSDIERCQRQSVRPSTYYPANSADTPRNNVCKRSKDHRNTNGLWRRNNPHIHTIYVLPKGSCSVWINNPAGLG